MSEPLPPISDATGAPSVLSEMPGPTSPPAPEDPLPAPAAAMPNLCPDSFQPIFRLHQTISHTPGDAGDLTTLGGFFPHVMENGIWYFDGQFDILESTDNPGEQTLNFASNLGLGFRWYDPEDDNVLGLSLWYDCDRSRPEFAHQGSIGLEMRWGRFGVGGATPIFRSARIARRSASAPWGRHFSQGFNILFPRERRFDRLEA